MEKSVNLTSILANFEGKCVKCEKPMIKGQAIFKIDESYWCSDPNCGKTTKKIEAQPIKEKIEIMAHQEKKDYEKNHDEIWSFAKEQASKESNLDTLGRNILSQVFYKKTMDFIIHKKKSLD